MKLVDVLKHAYFVGEGVEYILRRAIDYVYTDTGFHDDRAGHPTFLAVREVVFKQRFQGRMSLWKASALRVIESLCFRHGLGPVVNGRAEGFASLLDQNVVLELDALSDSHKVFLTEAIILWIYEYRKGQELRTSDATPY